VVGNKFIAIQINVTDTLINALINIRNSAIFLIPKHCSTTISTSLMGKLPVPFLPFVFSTLFTLIIPSASGLSFNFTSFIVGADQNISYEEAYPADGAIQLTKNLRNANMNCIAALQFKLPSWESFLFHFFLLFSQLSSH
jgi:hypothetical protein